MANIDKITLRGINYSIIDSSVPSYVKGITQTDITNWNNKPDSFTETDPTVPSYVKSITQQNINDWNNKLDSFTETDPIFTASAAHRITASDISNWNSKTDNVGTVTGITMNNTSKGTSGVIDLGTVLTEHQSLLSYATSANYDSNTKKIYLKHGSTTLSEIDATDFIKDGMVDTAYVQGSNLVISFNTDAGKEAVNVPIANIFNANNYYTKSEIDNASYVQWENSSTAPNTNTLTINRLYIESSSDTGDFYGNGCILFNDNDFSIESNSDSFIITSGWRNGETDALYSFVNDKRGEVAVTNDITKAINSYVISASYLQSFTETDPTVPSHVKSITQQNINNWNNKLSSETQLSKGTTTGSGNAVTDISVSNHQITLTKGSTFLTSHQDIKTINNQTITGTGNVTINELPTVSSSDNGKVLQVVNGVWTLVSPVTLYSGTGAPNNSQGNNGDLYMQI